MGEFNGATEANHLGEIVGAAALMPSSVSEATSFTPRRPRRASFLRKVVQKVSASTGQYPAEYLTSTVGIDANGGGLRYSGLSPASFTTLPHFAWSSRMKVRNAAGSSVHTS